MKSIHALLAFALLTFAACSSDADHTDGTRREMTFRANASISNGWTLLARGTEPASAPTYEPLPGTYAVSVSSLLRPAPGDTKNTQDAFLKKQPLTHVTNNGESKWVAQDCYWPVSGSMDFIAWGTSSQTQIDPQYISFVQRDVQGNVTDNDEHLTTDFEEMQLAFGATLDGSDDIIYSHLTKGATRTDPSVPLSFHHATSCVAVAIKAGDKTTAELFGISGAEIDSAYLSGTLRVKLENTTTGATTAQWDNDTRIKREHVALEAFTPQSDPFVYLPMPTETTTEAIAQPLYVLPQTSDKQLNVSYSIKGGSTHTFTFPFKKLWKDASVPEEWQMGKRYTYAFTCTLRQIEIDSVNVSEENWNTEIGGSAYEPDWNVEISTGAMEASWSIEIGGEAFEMTWRVEIGVSALEASWVSEMQAAASESNWKIEIGSSAAEGFWNTEIGAGASENNWNSELGAGAGEEDWNGETGGTASEEYWRAESGGNAYEEEWEVGDTIVIGGDTTPTP